MAALRVRGRVDGASDAGLARRTGERGRIEGWDPFLLHADWDDITIIMWATRLVHGRSSTLWRGYRIEIGMLFPFNGRNIFRNRGAVIENGNMNGARSRGSAADLGMARSSALFRHVYNNSEGITGSAADVRSADPGRKYHIFQPGEVWIYRQPTRFEHGTISPSGTGNDEATRRTSIVPGLTRRSDAPDSTKGRSRAELREAQ